MHTLAAAARQLAGAHTVGHLAAIADACGFTLPAAPLDAVARAALGLPANVRVATVLEGRGVLRALCLEIPRGACTRDVITRLVVRVQRRSPFALWLVLATERHGDAVGIATAVLAPHPAACLMLTDRRRVVDSDAETLRALVAARDGVDLLVHARWHEVLGRDAVTQRFFRALEHAVTLLTDSLAPRLPAADARTLAILTSTRMLFLSFLESKGWLDGDHGFLRRQWDTCMDSRWAFHRRVIDPLCFGTLNTPRSRRAPAARAFGAIPFLNGGLFTRTPLERRHRHAHFSNAALGPLVSDLLGRWRFTVREHDTSLAEAAVDPEMLGRAFECLMASRERRASGTFYTPRPLVARVFGAALASAFTPWGIQAHLESLTAGRALSRAHARELCARLAAVRVLDPACGSGAFLVHALDELARLRAASGDTLDPGALRRDILTRQLFGVDREPIAVWLCELRLWLSVVVETHTDDPDGVPPLPNLDANVRVGDALNGDAFNGHACRGDAFAPTGAGRLPTVVGQLRERYARATGPRKRGIARLLAAAERDAASAALAARLARVRDARRDIVSAFRGRDLFGQRAERAAPATARLAELRTEARQLRAELRGVTLGGAVAFDFAAQFADVGAHGGFDMVIGNPPWVRLHNIPSLERARLRARFTTFRDAGWRAGAAIAGISSAFAAQVDLAALFVERALALVREGGTVSLLVPAKLWRSLAGGGVRRLLMTSAALRELEDWSEARATFDAAVYPSLVVAMRTTNADHTPICVAEHHRDRALRWTVAARELPFDASPGAPWLWLPRDARDGFDRMRVLGTPLAEHDGLRPRLGVKCGCNEAFVLRGDARVTVERHVTRPLLRGEDVTPWRIDEPRDRIVFPHDDALRPLVALPPLARRRLLPYRAQLLRRADLRGRAPWWSLFRLEGADASHARVVWADMSRTPRAAVIPAHDPTVPINTCYVVRTRHEREAHALAVWLNAPLAAAWLAALAEPARGGYRRLLGWTVGLLPIPHDWERAIDLLAPIGEDAAHGHAPDTPLPMVRSNSGNSSRRYCRTTLTPGWPKNTSPCFPVPRR